MKIRLARKECSRAGTNEPGIGAGQDAEIVSRSSLHAVVMVLCIYQRRADKAMVKLSQPVTARATAADVPAAQRAMVPTDPWHPSCQTRSADRGNQSNEASIGDLGRQRSVAIYAALFDRRATDLSQIGMPASRIVYSFSRPQTIWQICTCQEKNRVIILHNI
jgi:hypothetical protein